MWVKSSKVDENDTNQYFINDFPFVTTAISLTTFKLFNVQDTMTFTSGLGATQGHTISYWSFTLNMSIFYHY